MQIRQVFEERERRHRQEFENFLQKNRGNQYMTNLKMLQFKLYQYKEYVKLFANNYRSPLFRTTRKALWTAALSPSVTLLFFVVFSPFSVLRGVMIGSVTVGSSFALLYHFGNELDYLARKDKGDLGFVIRYR